MYWQTLFTPDIPVFETILRGTVVYLTLFLLLRLVYRREAAAVGITDLLLLVLIADAIQNAMAGSYNSIASGVILVTTIVFWNFALNWLGNRVPFIERLLRPSPLPLIENGRLNRKNMRHELLTIEEIMSAIRQSGIEEISQVKRMIMEGDGQFSVIPIEGQEVKPREKKEAER